MLNQELLVKILVEMNEDQFGQIHCGRYAGDTEGHIKAHHVDILEDLGLVQWTSDSMVRITAMGYQFLNELDSDSGSDWVKAFKAAKTPIEITVAAANIIQLISGAGIG